MFIYYIVYNLTIIVEVQIQKAEKLFSDPKKAQNIE